MLLPPIYALFLFVTGDEASRVSGYSATHLALLTAQCRQVKQRRVLRFVPVWSLPWLLLTLDLFLLPSAPGLLHFYAICLGLNCILSQLFLPSRLLAQFPTQYYGDPRNIMDTYRLFLIYFCCNYEKVVNHFV